MSPQKNPYHTGNVVTMVHFNGSGEGVLWRVKRVRGVYLKLEPLFTVTGPSILKEKRVAWHAVSPVDLVELCTARAELDNIIRDVVMSMSADGETEVIVPENEKIDYDA